MRSSYCLFCRGHTVATGKPTSTSQCPTWFQMLSHGARYPASTLPSCLCETEILLFHCLDFPVFPEASYPHIPAFAVLVESVHSKLHFHTQHLSRMCNLRLCTLLLSLISTSLASETTLSSSRSPWMSTSQASETQSSSALPLNGSHSQDQSSTGDFSQVWVLRFTSCTPRASLNACSTLSAAEPIR